MPNFGPEWYIIIALIIVAIVLFAISRMRKNSKPELKG